MTIVVRDGNGRSMRGSCFQLAVGRYVLPSFLTFPFLSFSFWVVRLDGTWFPRISPQLERVRLGRTGSQQVSVGSKWVRNRNGSTLGFPLMRVLLLA